MEFAPGAITLDDIVGGTLQVGEIPNARLEADLTALADALTAGGQVPHAKLTENLISLANALTVGGQVPHAKLSGNLIALANALTVGGVVPNGKLTPYLAALADLLTGGGNIPFRKFFVGSWRYDNAGNVVLPAGGIAIQTLNMGSIVADDEILVTGQVHVVKGAGAAGEINVSISQTAGTAVLRFFSGPHWNASANCMNVPVGDQADINLAVQCYCLTSGTCTLTLAGSSQNGNSTVLAGQGLIAAWRCINP